ncbi:MAG TPA: hypothetical protein VLS53_06395, partial [Candidatus Dormibacteraeota bacterium]|nr:hypothetical protein [Candidatus Dormibacteraeota bacterium]
LAGHRKLWDIFSSLRALSPVGRDHRLAPIPRQSREITAPALSLAFVNWRVGFRNSISRSLDGIRTFDPLVDSDKGMTCAECHKNSPFLFGTT